MTMRWGIIGAGILLAGGAMAADAQSAFVSVALSENIISMSPLAAHPHRYADYGLWSIQVKAGTYHLITETCDFEIDEVPPFKTMQGPGDARFDNGTKYRYGAAIGGSKKLLRRGLTRGTVPEDADDKWSDFSITRNAMENNGAAMDNNFFGVLQHPKPVAGTGTVTAVQPACDSLHASSAIFFGRMHDPDAPADTIVVEVFEIYDATEPFEGGAKLEHLQDGFYIATMRKDAFEPDTSNIARALVKAGEPVSP